jgi:tungstate transport system substrate-binding protein
MMKKSIQLITIVILIALLTLTACSQGSSTNTNGESSEIILATTTSTQDSGLLDFLLPKFHEENNYIVKTIAVGTGKALQMAVEGNADVLFVHAPSAELELVQDGFGIDRTLVMHNDFVIVGPSNDPAGISGLGSASEAFQRIYDTGALFISRGDDSGTHKKEKEFWTALIIQPQGESYIESGQGMAATLKIASEKYGYTLTDRATYLANQANLDLQILTEGDLQLLNVYHVIAVNPEKWPKVNYSGAQAFTAFLVSEEVQQMIGQFGVDQYGQPLFFPDAGKSESELGLD